MKCANCGTENADARFCTECGSDMKPAAQKPTEAPVSEAAPAVPPAFDQGPPPGYVPPHVQAQVPRVPTVRYLHLGDILLLIAGATALAVGLENLAIHSGQYVLLGMVALLGGVFFLGQVIMPETVRQVGRYVNPAVEVFSAILLIWGVVANFAVNVGVGGGFLAMAGLLGLAAVGLRLGMIK